jgi:hypothetical protein
LKPRYAARELPAPLASIGSTIRRIAMCQELT